MATPKRRQCSVCGRTRAASQYYRNGNGLYRRCRQCHQAKAKAARLLNPQAKAYGKAAAHRYQHSPKGKAAKRRYKRSYSGRLHSRLQSLRRRSRAHGVAFDCAIADLKAIVQRWGGWCAYCGSPALYVFDHVIPMKRGGPTVPANLVPACYKPCNHDKATRNVLAMAEASTDPKQRHRYARVLRWARQARGAALLQPLWRQLLADLRNTAVNF